VLFSSTSGQGHLQPLIPLIRAFEEQGHDVLTVAPASLANTLGGAGINFRLGNEPSQEDSDRVWTLFPTLDRTAASRLVEREWFARLCTDALLPAVRDAADEWSPELVIRETCEYASALVAHQRGISQFQVGISTAAAESSVLHDLAKPELEERSAGLTNRIFESPYLSKFPASLDPSPYPSTLRYRDGERTTRGPLGDWWHGNQSPLVYLTFGTMATGTKAGQDLLRAVLSTIQDLDLRILVTTGSKMKLDNLNIANNVHVESWVAQDDIFSLASLVICHGGSGTTFGALAAGVPLVFLPMFADQPTNAALIEGAGAGIIVGDGGGSAESNSDASHLRMSLLRDAISDVLDKPKYRDAARALGEEINAAEPINSLVHTVVASL
jgi:UDP:flavonoid glycosyltransferase YjiC (YdhE family)